MKTHEIPKQLEEIFDRRGCVTPPEVGRGHGFRVERVIWAIKDGTLPAFDARSPGGKRPVYKILRSHLLEWYQNMAVESGAIEPTPPAGPRHRKRKTVHDCVDEIPDYMSGDIDSDQYVEEGR